MHSDGKKKVSRFEFAIMQAAGIDQTNVEPKTEEEEIQERIDNLKNQASRIRIKNTSSSYIPTKEVPPEETAQALRDKLRKKNKECESLRSELQSIKAYHEERLEAWHLELQKQKELNAELVEGLKMARDLMKTHVPSSQSGLYVEWIEARDIIESLIKKYKES